MNNDVLFEFWRINLELTRTKLAENYLQFTARKFTQAVTLPDGEHELVPVDGLVIRTFELRVR